MQLTACDDGPGTDRAHTRSRMLTSDAMSGIASRYAAESNADLLTLHEWQPKQKRERKVYEFMVPPEESDYSTEYSREITFIKFSF